MKLNVKRIIVRAIATALIFIGASSLLAATETSPTTNQDEFKAEPTSTYEISVTTTNGSNTPINDKSEFSPDATTIGFSERGLDPGTFVTDQYARFGVTFSSSSEFVQTRGSCDRHGLSGDCLGILPIYGICPGPHSIFLDKPTGIAGFNILTNADDNAKLTARLRGVDVETRVFITDAGEEHFIGIKNSGGFDELKLEIIPDADSEGANGCPLIDNLIFDPVLPVHIDIKPGTSQNSINLCSKGTVPVAILGSSAFNVYDVYTDTLRFSDASVKMVGKKDPHVLCSHEDVNFDGFTDLVCHYVTMDLDMLGGESSSATLNGSLFDGTVIEGTDVVNIVKDSCF